MSANGSIAAGTRGSVVLLLDSEGRGEPSGRVTVRSLISTLARTVHGSVPGPTEGMYSLSDAGTSLWEFGRAGGVERRTAPSPQSRFHHLPITWSQDLDNRNIYYFAFTEDAADHDPGTGYDCPGDHDPAGRNPW